MGDASQEEPCRDKKRGKELFALKWFCQERANPGIDDIAGAENCKCKSESVLGRLKRLKKCKKQKILNRS